MTRVTVSRDIAADPETVREQIRSDVPSFVRASGFDSVTIEGDTITVARKVGLATFELTLEMVESDGVLALDQTEGFFDEMWTEYTVEQADSGSRVTAVTEFTIGPILGPVLDSTIITTQRRKEFEMQFDYLESTVAQTA